MGAFGDGFPFGNGRIEVTGQFHETAGHVIDLAFLGGVGLVETEHGQKMFRLFEVAQFDGGIGNHQPGHDLEALRIGPGDGAGPFQFRGGIGQMAFKDLHGGPPEGDFVVILQAFMIEVGLGLGQVVHERLADPAHGDVFRILGHFLAVNRHHPQHAHGLRPESMAEIKAGQIHAGLFTGGAFGLGDGQLQPLFVFVEVVGVRLRPLVEIEDFGERLDQRPLIGGGGGFDLRYFGNLQTGGAGHFDALAQRLDPNAVGAGLDDNALPRPQDPELRVFEEPGRTVPQGDDRNDDQVVTDFRVSQGQGIARFRHRQEQPRPGGGFRLGDGVDHG